MYWTWFTEALMSKDKKVQAGYQFAVTKSLYDASGNVSLTIFMQHKKLGINASLSRSKFAGFSTGIRLQYQLFK